MLVYLWNIPRIHELERTWTLGPRARSRGASSGIRQRNAPNISQMTARS